MKINSITPAHIHPKSGRFETSPVKSKKRNINNNDKINTTIKMNSDGRASFKGGVPLLHRAANYASYNPLVAEALFAILITCGLRPLTIMATAKNEEEKEKCSYQAAKSISSGLVGLAMTALVGTPIAAATKFANANGHFKMPQAMREKSEEIVKQGIDALKTFSQNLVSQGTDMEFAQTVNKLIEGDKLNIGIFKKAEKGAEKLFQTQIKEKAPDISETVINAMKEQRVLNNYSRTVKNVMDKLFQPAFMPLRATITVALVPVILGLLGKKKPGQKENKTTNPQTILNYKVFQTSNEKELFRSFSGVANHEN